MSADRVAEALAVLEAAEKAATRSHWKWNWATEKDSYIVTPGICATSRTKSGYEDAQFIAKARNSFPALLKLARAATDEHWHPGLQLEALSELAEAVLG